MCVKYTFLLPADLRMNSLRIVFDLTAIKTITIRLQTFTTMSNRYQTHKVTKTFSDTVLSAMMHVSDVEVGSPPEPKERKSQVACRGNRIYKIDSCVPFASPRKKWYPKSENSPPRNLSQSWKLMSTTHKFMA